jgi:prepilin-type N-terminal cleavage/methylation domain-containing protein
MTRHRLEKRTRNFRAGFTFIEVLVAMLIFTLAAVTAVTIAQGSVRATRDAKVISTATWLLQRVMTDLEDQLESQGIDKACDKKKDGKFDPPNDNFTWLTECYPIDFKLSETAAKMMAAMGKDGSDNSDQQAQQDAILKMVMDTASKYISDSMREIHAEVHWNEGKQKREIDVTTHYARYDKTVQFPGFGGIGSGTTPGSTTQ